LFQEQSVSSHLSFQVFSSHSFSFISLSLQFSFISFIHSYSLLFIDPLLLLLRSLPSSLPPLVSSSLQVRCPYPLACPPFVRSQRPPTACLSLTVLSSPLFLSLVHKARLFLPLPPPSLPPISSCPGYNPRVSLSLGRRTRPLLWSVRPSPFVLTPHPSLSLGRIEHKEKEREKEREREAAALSVSSSPSTPPKTIGNGNGHDYVPSSASSSPSSNSNSHSPSNNTNGNGNGEVNTPAAPTKSGLLIIRVVEARGLTLPPGSNSSPFVPKEAQTTATSNRESLQRKWWLPYAVLEFDKNEVLIDALGGEVSNPLWQYRAHL